MGSQSSSYCWRKQRIVSEINPNTKTKRYDQGWLSIIADSTDDAIDKMIDSKNRGKAMSLFITNIIELLERIVELSMLNQVCYQIKLNCAIMLRRVYYPVTLSFEEGKDDGFKSR